MDRRKRDTCNYLKAFWLPYGQLHTASVDAQQTYMWNIRDTSMGVTLFWNMPGTGMMMVEKKKTWHVRPVGTKCVSKEWSVSTQKRYTSMLTNIYIHTSLLKHFTQSQNDICFRSINIPNCYVTL